VSNNKNRFIDFLKNIATTDNGKKLADKTQQTILSYINTSIPKELNINSLFDVIDINIIESYNEKIVGTDFDKGNNILDSDNFSLRSR